MFIAFCLQTWAVIKINALAGWNDRELNAIEWKKMSKNDVVRNISNE